MRCTNIYRFIEECVVVAVAVASAGAQSRVDLRTQAKSVDFSAASSTTPFQTGTALPGACSQGQVFFKTNAAPGANFFACTAANTWTLESGSASQLLANNNSWSGSNDFTGAAGVSLPSLFLRSDTGWTMTAGQTIVANPSATTAGLRLTSGALPSTQAGGDLFMNP